ncbi:unnamed protein product [Allacma fusca]|uniref:Major facilitator superfamily (MFS) profile domain-containing protein n=1 Tax=Allacma fusca TaxID=39272 RepID=A0A8J2LVC7_9HEXA|nr:unnamed protein product [Allacma fusca]
MNEQELHEAEILSRRTNSEENPPVRRGGVLQQVFAAFSISYLCISAGNFLGYTSTAIPSMRSDPEHFSNLTHHDVSWIGSLSPLGAMCGSVLATIPIGRWGARNTVAVSSFYIHSILPWRLNL